MSKRASFPMDYDKYAPTYAWSRHAVPWVIRPLAEIVAALLAGAAVLEIGCGTGNYVNALANIRPNIAYFGFDLSESMLSEARACGRRVTFKAGDAAKEFPFPDRRFSLAFAVDVVHHIGNLRRFFAEAQRVLVSGGHLLIVTDSEETLRQRSLTVYFPEILPVELARYPRIAQLDDSAVRAGLDIASQSITEGYIPLDPEFLAKLEAKCSSSMRLITSEQHAAGMNRIRAAAARGDQWLSRYDVLHYVRPRRVPSSLNADALDSEEPARADSLGYGFRR
ncbi:MAG: class I SAM-dependent methyltransferase [Longimicrobiales bacterium]